MYKRECWFCHAEFWEREPVSAACPGCREVVEAKHRDWLARVTQEAMQNGAELSQRKAG